MNLQYFKYFITLAEHKNFTKAAEKNFVVQSTFSAGIKKLEEILDCKLFYRDKRNVSLTKEGEQLLPKAKEMLTLWNNIETSYKSEQFKTLTIGVQNNIYHADVVMPVLKNFKTLYPSCAVELIEGLPEQLIDKLRKDELDVIFAQDTDLESDVFAKSLVHEENVQVLLPASHELQNRKKIKLEELDGLPFIEHANCILTREVEKEFQEKNYHFNTVFSAQNTDILTSLVAANMGISLMPKPKSHIDSLIFVPLADAQFKRRIMMIWKHSNQSQALKHFLSV